VKERETTRESQNNFFVNNNFVTDEPNPGMNQRDSNLSMTNMQNQCQRYNSNHYMNRFSSISDNVDRKQKPKSDLASNKD